MELQPAKWMAGACFALALAQPGSAYAQALADLPIPVGADEAAEDGECLSLFIFGGGDAAERASCFRKLLHCQIAQGV